MSAHHANDRIPDHRHPSHEAGRSSEGTGPDRPLADGISRRGVFRGFVVATTAAGFLAGPAGSAVAARRQAQDRKSGVSDVADTAVVWWEDRARRYAATYQQTEDLRTLVEVSQDLRSLDELTRRPQPLAHRARLIRVVAELSGLVGVLMTNLGEHRKAGKWFHTARLAAEEIEDRPLRAWVLGRGALVPFYAGDVDAAVHMARAGEAVAASGPPTSGAALSIMSRARAQALRGEADAARGAVDRGYALVSRLDDDDQGNLLFGYTLRQWYFHAGQVYTLVGDNDRARHAHRAARRMYRPDEYLDPALMGLDEALRQANEGDVDAAAVHAVQVVTALGRGQRIVMVENKARELHRTLRGVAGGSASVRHLHEVLTPGTTAG